MMITSLTLKTYQSFSIIGRRSMRMNMREYIHIFVFILAAGSVGVLPAYAFQERVYVDVVERGREADITLFIDSETPVNAFLFEITYDTARAEFLSSNESGSIADIWQTFPPRSEAGVIMLQGGMIKPFIGTKGKIITLTFRALKEETAPIRLQKAILYAADGKGTEVVPETESFERDVGVDGVEEADGMKEAESIEDHIPPQFIDVDAVAVPGKDIRLVSFRVKDEETGVKEMTVSVRRWIGWEDMIRAPNPIEAPQDVWSVRLVARDNAGNAAIHTVIIWQHAIKKVLLIFIILGVCVLGVRVIARAYLSWRRKERRI